MLFSMYRVMPRSPVVFIVAGVIISFFLVHFFQRSYYLPTTIFEKEEPVNSTALLLRQSTFWASFYPNLLKYGPTCDPLTHPEGTHLELFYDPFNDTIQRPDVLNMTTSQVLELRTTHSKFISHLRGQEYSLPYLRKSRGIVTTAGGSYLPVAVVSIRMLRSTGSQLPVEVFLASKDEWDSEICDNVFPAMNTRCVVLQDIFDTAGQDDSITITKYQYKIMSIVFSSFEEVLFMDSDCFPVFDPMEIFDSEPFQSTGLILWPDFWFPSESPLFFEIAGIPTPAMNSRSSTESGEIFYCKERHRNSLLLALYYNYYGPRFYYPLQSQGAPGEGDKETFLWSAVVFKEPFYNVRKSVSALGYHTTKGEWRGSAMAQYDPRAEVQEPAQSDTKTLQRPFFVHANFPKFDPATIFEIDAMGATGPTIDSDGTLRRVWHSDEAASIQYFGFDLERRLWDVIRGIGCDYEGRFSAWAYKTNICAKAMTYWKTVFEPTMND